MTPFGKTSSHPLGVNHAVGSLAGRKQIEADHACVAGSALPKRISQEPHPPETVAGVSPVPLDVDSLSAHSHPVAASLLKHDPGRGSIKTKRLKAALNEDYLVQVLQGFIED